MIQHERAILRGLAENTLTFAASGKSLTRANVWGQLHRLTIDLPAKPQSLAGFVLYSRSRIKLGGNSPSM
jgi:hypothetical protein